MSGLKLQLHYSLAEDLEQVGHLPAPGLSPGLTHGPVVSSW